MPRRTAPALALLPVLLIGGLGGCQGDRLAPPTGDTGLDTCVRLYDGEVRIREAQVRCLSPNRVRLSADARGWTSGATLYAVETGNPAPRHAEQHDLTTFKFGSCREFDLLDQELGTGVALEAWRPNTASAFSCEQASDGEWVHLGDPEDGGVMTYVLRVYGLDGSLADCLAWGHDPEGLLSGAFPADLPVDRPGELKACTVGEYAGAPTTPTASDTAAP